MSMDNVCEAHRALHVRYENSLLFLLLFLETTSSMLVVI